MLKRFFIIVLCVIFNFIGLSGCTKSKDSPENQIIKYNLNNEPLTLDPQVCNDSSSKIIIMNIFEGLVRLDENENIVPGVAYSWEVSEDKLTYIFYLRENASWSNKEKTPVTAEDFVFGFRRALDKYTQAPKAYTLYCIKNARKVNLEGADNSLLGVKAQDARTLVIELEYPMENFLELLATPPTMPCNKNFFEQTNGQYGLESSTVICNGAFKIKPRYGWDHYNSINLVENENYGGQNIPIPAGVSFTIDKDTTDAINLIKNGTIDAAALTSEEQINSAKSNGFQTTSFDDTVCGLMFNTQDSLFSNLNVRLGFLKALDRESILSELPENCKIANDILLDGIIADGKNFRELAGRDLVLKKDAEAKKYFDSGIEQQKLRSLPTVTILCRDTQGTKKITSNIIENLNRELGYYFNMEPLSEDALKSRIATKNYQIALMPILAESNLALDFLNIFRSDNNKNFANLNSKDYDKLIENALLTTPKDSVKHLLSAEKYLNENAVFYPMYNRKSFFVSSSKLSRLIFHRYNQGIDFYFATKIK